MPNSKNQQNLELIKEKLTKAKSVLVVDYSGTTVNEQSELRANLKKTGGEFFVTKNTLIGLGFDNKPEIKDQLSGMNALILSYDDEVGAVKVAYDFIKDKEKLTVKVGYLDGKFLSESEAATLSKTPGKQELMGMLVRTLNSPATNLVSVLKANIRDLTYVLQAIADKK
ncbi:MAG: 50S ribosomal protein L10 [bacterium]|nr:50S ribosomal protein L10 [bacterium]